MANQSPKSAKNDFVNVNDAPLSLPTTEAAYDAAQIPKPPAMDPELAGEMKAKAKKRSAKVIAYRVNESLFGGYDPEKKDYVSWPRTDTDNKNLAKRIDPAPADVVERICGPHLQSRIDLGAITPIYLTEAA